MAKRSADWTGCQPGRHQPNGGRQQPDQYGPAQALRALHGKLLAWRDAIHATQADAPFLPYSYQLMSIQGMSQWRYPPF